MILGIGTDIVEINRIEVFFKDSKKLSRIFTTSEIEYINSKGKGKFQTAAGVFSAKEALSKSLGTGFTSIGLLDIEVKHYTTGKPYLSLNLPIDNRIFHLSISHSDLYATATVICEGI